LVTTKRGSVFRFMTSVCSCIIWTSRADTEVFHSVQIHPDFLGGSQCRITQQRQTVNVNKKC
jgi:hypothetical protein